MKQPLTLIFAPIVVVVVLLYAVTYQVRFDQTAVVTTFGAASEGSVYNAQADKDESGLKWKWPPPINTVKTFDKRVQVLEGRPEEQQTKDLHSIVVQTYLAWRISNPLEFYRALGSVDAAENQLRSTLRDAHKIIGERFTFDELTNTDPKKLKLTDAENAILEWIKEKVAASQQPYGIELVSVGIKRILLAPKTTEDVFARMKATRQRMAQGALTEGDATAAQIKSEAEGKSKTILSFADRRARDIRAEGEDAAAAYVNVFKADEKFAVFLRKIDAYKQLLADTSKGKTTLIIDAKTDWLFRELYSAPGEEKPTTPAAK